MCLTLKMPATTLQSNVTLQSSVTLSPREHRTLSAICETLIPALSAGRLNVADAMEQSLTRLELAQQRQFRTLLRLLEQPLFIAFLVHKLKGFSQLAEADRMRVLQRLAVCKLEKLRIGFQAMKRLALFTFYS